MPCPEPQHGATIPLVEPLDTPPDWFNRIAQRAAEWRDLGPVEAARRWNARGQCGAAVLAVVEAMEAK